MIVFDEILCVGVRRKGGLTLNLLASHQEAKEEETDDDGAGDGKPAESVDDLERLEGRSATKYRTDSI